MFTTPDEKQSVQDNTYELKGLLEGRTYQFRVCAVNRIGDSDFVTSESIEVASSRFVLVEFRQSSIASFLSLKNVANSFNFL